MLETGTVSSCLTFDFEVELHMRTLTDLANQASLKMINLMMTRTKPTAGRSIRQSVRSGTDCLSANKMNTVHICLGINTIE